MKLLEGNFTDITELCIPIVTLGCNNNDMESLRKFYPPTQSHGTKQEERIFAYKNKKAYYIDTTFKTILKIFTFSVMAIIVFSILRNFIYIDIQNKCFITIDPGVIEFNNASLVDGLKLIKVISPEDYRKVCQNVNSISPNLGCGGIHGGCFYQNQPKKIYVNNVNRIVLYAAAIIVHETCHSIQASSGQSMNENKCYLADDRIIKMIVQF
jgi:hypothetical protein